MATVRTNHPKTGPATYSVLYRHGGKQTSTTRDTPEEAEKLKTLIELLGVDAALATVNASPSALKVDELFEEWIAWKPSTGVTARTLKDYRRDYDNWIRPALGMRVAETVDELDVQRWVDRMAHQLDPKSVGDRHMILSGMFKYGAARTRRLVPHNPCLETQLPSKKKKAPKGFTRAQWDAMHAWGQEHEPDADDLLLLLHDTGWRISEATPLTVGAVEDYGDIEVHGHLVPWVFVSVLGVHRRDEDDRMVFVEGEAKSRAGSRRINLPPESARMIRRRVVGKGPEDLLFTAPRGGQWRATQFNARPFARILEGAGITKVKGMGPHYLRHTHVGELDRAGVSLAKTQRRIGHENISTTIGVYGGMIDNTLSPEELLALSGVALPGAPMVVPGAVVAGGLEGAVVRGELG